MKLLLDQGLPRSTVKHLAAAGIAAEHVADLGMAGATDAAILDVAQGQRAAVVTLDAELSPPARSFTCNVPRHPSLCPSTW